MTIQNLVSLLSRSLLGLLLVMLSACSSLPKQGERSASSAWSDPDATSLGRIVSDSLPAGRQDLSGFRLMHLGAFAFNTRIELVRRAEKTLDLQYYQIASDESGLMLFKELTAAAKRGVRIRLLVDDLFTVGEDQTLRKLAETPNIEVRLFNPFVVGRKGLASKFILSLNDFKRVNHRMHNKLFVADNAMAITGGRNIGDEYFMYATASNFIDIDTFIIGEVVQDLSKVFDGYWNSDYVYPVQAIIENDLTDTRSPAPPDFGIEKTRGPLPPDVHDELGYAPLALELERGKLDLNWAKGMVLADSPDKVMGINAQNMSGTVTSNIMQVMNDAHEEVIVISPYFIPGKIGMEAIKRLSERKVRMVLVTNSLAATDSPLVHIGYSRYRAEMVRLGVEVYEINPIRKGKTSIYNFGSSKAMLHAKIAVIDRKQVFIGSMNSDPRSSRENTEMGVIIQSPKMAMEIISLMRKDGPTGSYTLRTAESSSGVEWVKHVPQGETLKDEVETDEPEAGFWLKFSLKLLSPLAPEELL